MSRLRVLLVDDERLVLQGLSMIIGSEPGFEVVGAVQHGDEVAGAVERLAPDIVLMDLHMPGTDGIEATRRLTADQAGARATVPVLALTTFSDDREVYGVLRAGASGFLLKDADESELFAAIRSVAAGDAWLAPAVARRLLIDLTSRPDPDLPPPVAVEALTPRERHVLGLVAHGLSNREIAVYLTVGEATIKTHMGRVLMKLGLRDRAQAVALAYQSGLVTPGEAPL